jgi:hypothetical protein
MRLDSAFWYWDTPTRSGFSRATSKAVSTKLAGNGSYTMFPWIESFSSNG